MRRPRSHSDHLLSLDLTSMVDVVFLLIIFFMTTAQFVRLTRTELDLPREKGEQTPEAEEAGLVINLTQDGRLIVSASEIALDDLETMVISEMERRDQGEPSAFKLLIRADRAADTAHLNRLVSRLQQLGVGAARIATEVPRS